MNSSEPELETLKYFYKKLVKGGIIYFDDYGWSYPELRKVVDEFFSDKPETLLHFPSGNSIVVKIWKIPFKIPPLKILTPNRLEHVIDFRETNG